MDAHRRAELLAIDDLRPADLELSALVAPAPRFGASRRQADPDEDLDPTDDTSVDAYHVEVEEGDGVA